MSNNDWSKLITINYPGGFGGDFFNKILYKSLNGIDLVDQKKSEFNRYAEVLCFFPEREHNLLKAFRFLSHDDAGLDYAFDSSQGWETAHGFDSKTNTINIKRKFYHPDRKTYVKNLEDYLYTVYNKNQPGYNILNIHNTTIRSNRLMLQELFPGSYNIGLMCYEITPYLLFRVLMFYKLMYVNFYVSQYDDSVMYVRDWNSIVGELYIKDSLDVIVKNIIDYWNPAMFDSTEFQIDSYDLFFNETDYDGILSEYLNTTVSLDKTYIKKWKNEAIDILNMIGLNYQKKYTFEEVFFIMKKFLIENCKRIEK